MGIKKKSRFDLDRDCYSMTMVLLQKQLCFLILIGRFELFKETDVVFEEVADVFDAVFEHGDSFNAHSEGKTGVFFTVDVARFQYVGVYHTAAQNFEPAGIFTYVAAFATANRAAYIHFSRWFREREVGGTQANLGFLAEKLTGKIQKGLFQVGE